MTPAIAQLVVYPIKSCAGISISKAQITPQGLPFDRRWMVVDEDTGRFVTQRTHPQMATIQAQLPLEVLEGDATPDAANAAALVLSAPGVEGSVRVPLAVQGTPELRPAKVWDWGGVAADEGDEAAAWLSALLDRRVRLVRYVGSIDASAAAAAAALTAQAVLEGGGAALAEGASSALTRSVDPEFVPWGSEVAFADGFPVLVATRESIEDLNGRLEEPIDISRFRPNVVLSGAGAAWADDSFGTIQLGGGGGEGSGVEVALVKPCSRCTVPLVDQRTGVVMGKEPIKTMQGFRSGRALGWGGRFGQGATFFGTNGQPLGTGTVRVGDAVRVVKQTDWAAAA